MGTLPSEPRIAYLQPGQLIPRDARDALHSFNVSTTALALLGSLADAGYEDLHFFDVACEQGDLLRDFNENLLYKGVSDADVTAWLRNVDPHVVCLTSMFTCDHPSVDHLCTLVGKAVPDATIIVGGRHASLKPDWTLENSSVDYVVQGEGEQSLPRLLDNLTGRANGYEPTKIPGVFTLDSFNPAAPKVWPEATLGGSFAHDMVLFKPDGSFRYKEVIIEDSPKDYLYKQHATELHSAPLMPTRGCPLACRFCGSHFTPEMRPAGVDRLFADIQYTYEKGVRIFYNISENFALHKADRELLEKMADFRDEVGGDFLLAHPNSTFLPVYMGKDGNPDEAFLDLIYRGGTHNITISVETFCPRFDDKKLFKKYSVEQVEKLWKSVHKRGMTVHLYMMTGFPDQTPEELMSDVRQIQDWIERGLVDAASWSNLLYLPGTIYYNQAVEKGQFSEAGFRKHIDEGFNFFAVPEKFNFSGIKTDKLREALAHLRVGNYDFDISR
jgi:radical SAM superfamily enzyme YgiQ (UPF0313 family)